MADPDYVDLPYCGFVRRQGDSVELRMTVEVAEALAGELHSLAFTRFGRGLVSADRGWKEMSAALFAVSQEGNRD